MGLTKLTHETIKAGRPSLEQVKEAKHFPVAVIAENIRSLYNVGSIFRTSDGAFIDTLYLCGYTGYPPRKEIDKTALGSVESVKWEYCQDPKMIVEKLKHEGYSIIALEHTSKSVPYAKFEYSFPLCLVVGNEVDGISQELLSLVDGAIDIPMYGIKQSLNVSVAYGIAIFHIIDTCINQGPALD